MEEQLKIRQHYLDNLKKELSLKEKIINNELFKHAKEKKIRKSFLKDILLFTDKILNDFFPNCEKKEAHGVYNYSYYEYDKQYLNTKINRSKKIFNWLEKRVIKYNEDQIELFKIVFPHVGEKLFGNKQSLIENNNLTIENLRQEIIQVAEEIHQIYSNCLNIPDYLNNFKSARKINRKFYLIFGPTNSGKTHIALQKLKESTTGLYLAPLRLLAIEIFQRLNEDGIPCNLITGEEKIIKPDAKITSSTIEMCDFHNTFETIIIDEVQMINDRDRGYAWTNAVIGAPANNVICLGTEEIKLTLSNLIEQCGSKSKIDNITLTTRLNELTIDKDNKIESGTALITFSRKQVLYYAELYRNKGFNVSVIYGALPPEVRKKQITRFNNGETDLIIATDAIGLGVNLPIAKIIFTDLEKFDGQSVRPLTSYEIKQIAGRAGRFNLNSEHGKISLYDNLSNIDNYAYLSQQLNQFKYYPNCIFISPLYNYIKQLCDISKDNNIYNLLKTFSNLKTGYKNWYITDISNQLLLAQEIELLHKELKLIDKYTIVFSPISIEYIGVFGEIIKNEISIDYISYFSKNEREPHCLETLEKRLNVIGNWAWFHNKYPDLFLINDLDDFYKYRIKLNNELDTKLIFKARKNIYLTELKNQPDLKNDINFFKKAIIDDVSIIKEAGKNVLNDLEIMKKIYKHKKLRYLINPQLLSLIETQ